MPYTRFLETLTIPRNGIPSHFSNNSSTATFISSQEDRPLYLEMPSMLGQSSIDHICALIILLLFPYTSCSFTISNNCPFTIWPGTLAGSGTPPLLTTGFQLDPGQSAKVPSTPGWSGRIWARTGCKFDQTGNGTCQTGDCGGKLECGGNGATPPASLFEITLGKGGDLDYYDVSLVDGYNLPIVAWPIGANGGCNATGCVADLNMGCPKELQVVGDDGGQGGVVACKSACEAFGLDQYCCSGNFGNPTTCQPSFYSTIFKRACPRAYSFAYDDGTSTFTCNNASDYIILFCPTTSTGSKTSNETYRPPPAQAQSNEEASGAVSSSYILHSFPTIFLLIFCLLLV